MVIAIAHCIRIAFKFFVKNILGAINRQEGSGVPVRPAIVVTRCRNPSRTTTSPRILATKCWQSSAESATIQRR